MITSSSSIQLNDSVINKKPILCPALEKYQDEYNLTMKKNAENNKLCKNWNVAGKNDSGVYVTEKHNVIVKKDGCTISLSMALRGEDVIAKIDIESRNESNYGRYSPLTDDYPSMRFDVYDHTEKVCDIISESISDQIESNGNLSSQSKKTFVSMIPEILDRVETELNA